MVYKVSKGGVRSGNTLRGLHTLRTKRYSLQACIVGRSSLPKKDVSRLLKSSTDDKLVTSTLGSTDVILSLNKKQRWLLPATVNNMIRTGRFNQDKTMVSLLERHKLKRRANCVGFVCNKGRFTHVAPKQKRYFSFNLENIDEEESNREKRRRRAEALKKSKVPKQKLPKDKSGYQTLNVFTLSGPKPEEREVRLPSTKPEYRLEVFYPCPASCSLAFNPKYTDVIMERGEDGEMEIRSNKKPGKTRKRHRKRFATKDAGDYVSEIIEDDVEEMWHAETKEMHDSESSHSRQAIEKDCHDLSENLQNIVSFYDDEEVASDDSGLGESTQLSENILASLIAQAEKARSLCAGGGRTRQRRKSSRVYHDLGSDIDERSHILYSNEKPQVTKPKLNPVVEQAPLSKGITLESAKVIMSSAETSPQQLKEKYGHLYSESESEPRRFVINITDDVSNLLSSSRNAALNSMYTSYLVFIYDGFYDDGLESFKVLFNSNVVEDTRFLKTAIPFEQVSVEEIVNRIACSLLDMKEENLLSVNNAVSYREYVRQEPSIISDALKLKVESFRTSEELSRVACGAGLQEKSELSSYLNKVSEDLDMDLFCEICYEDVNPSHLDATAGTQLTRCHHRFCDECWRTHLLTKTRDGAVKLTCPGYQCDVTVGPVTLLSLLHVSEVSKLLQRLREEELESSLNAKWCPNTECGRVIKLNTEPSASNYSLDVRCDCGTEVCFSCLSPAHWPARCEQAEDYMDKLATIKPHKETTDEPDVKPVIPPPKPSKKPVYFELEGRYCPGCQRFIEKDGGCPSMICKCGLNFCWSCLAPMRTHLTCNPNTARLYENTRVVRVRHLNVTAPPTFDDSTTSNGPAKKAASPRQRATMYQRAVQQRLEAKESGYRNHEDMAKAIMHVAQKDLAFKRELLTVCGQENHTGSDESLFFLPLLPLVSKFLRSSQEIKSSLHHVAEFTFVLLQDAPNSLDKRRALALANDISGYCSFLRSILELGPHQDLRSAVRRLVDIQSWARRALGTLLSIVDNLRC